MYTEREIFHLEEIVPLLEKCGLKLNGETDYTLGLYDGEELVATYEYCNLHGLWKA